MATVCEKCGQGLEAHDAQYECPLKGATEGEKLYNLLNEDLPLGVEAAYMSLAEVAALASGERATIYIGYDIGPIYVRILLAHDGSHKFNIRESSSTRSMHCCGIYPLDSAVPLSNFLQFIHTRLNRWRWRV